jgi:hypothetical protein
MLLQITKGLIRKPKLFKIKPLGLPMPTPYTGINTSTRPRGHSDYLLVKEHGKSCDFPKQLPTAFNRQSRDLTHLRPVRGRRIIASRFGLSTPSSHFLFSAKKP